MEFKKVRNKDGIIKENILLQPFDITYTENEKDVESLFKNYIEKVGWKINVSYARDKDIKNRYSFRNDIKGSTNGKPDYIFYNDKEEIIAICDAKSSVAGVNSSLDDGKEYIRCLNEDYNLSITCVIGFDGQKFVMQIYNGQEWFNATVDSTEIELMPDRDFLQYIIDSKNKIEEVPETDNIDRTLLSNFFKATDEIIRRSSIGSSPTEKFIELSTIIFLKMYALKEYDKLFFKKTENKSLKYSNIWEAVLAGDIALINDNFSKWLNETYKNIYLDESHTLISIESDKLVQVARLVDRIFGTYELEDFTNVKGDILEYFQSSSKDRKIGEFFTPRHIIKYMTKLIEPTVVNKNGDLYIEKIYDPTCGTGGFLIEVYNRYKDIFSKEIPDLNLLKEGILHGTELKSNTALLAKMNMILIGDGHTNIINADAFSYDKIEKVSKQKDAFGHFIPIDESLVDFYKEGDIRRFYVKGDKKRKVSVESENTTDYLYDPFGDKIEVSESEIVTKNNKKYSSDGYIVKKSNGKFYKQIIVKHYELKNELEENLKYEYKNIKSVNPKLISKNLNEHEENPFYHKDFGNYDVVLANQPFGLSEPTKADFHFIDHMLKSLHDNINSKTRKYGRIACIVDNGFLHDSKYLDERKSLQENYTIKGIISLPQKVFAPYVKTIKSNILLIEKRKPRTNEKTYFVKIENDGYSQDDKRTKLVDKDDFRELMLLWRGWNDLEYSDPETGAIIYEAVHKEKEGFAEYHILDCNNWAVTNYIKYVIPKFNYKNVDLETYITETTEKKNPTELVETDDMLVEIKGVSKKYGIITSEIKAASEYNQSYKVLKAKSLAYNPSRVNIGSIALNNQEEGLISPSYVVFQVDDSEFLPEYVMYFLKSEYGKKQIENYNNGTVRNSLSFEDLQKIKIPYMPLPEQKRIISLIANTTNAKIKLYDSYISLLKVGIPVSSFEKYQFEALDDLVLGDAILPSEKPSYGCSKKSDDADDGYPILKMNNIYPIIDEKALMDDVDTISLTDEEYEKYCLTENDVLINRTNSIELVGKTGIFKWKKEDLVKCVYASYLMRIAIKPEYSPMYISYYMNLANIKNDIRSFAFQSNGQYNINLENLKKLKIKYPKDSSIVEKIESEFEVYCSQLNNLSELANLIETEESCLFERFLLR